MKITLALGVPLAALTAAVSLAAPASAADQDDYLRPLLERYSFLSSQQLLSEASRVCALVSTGQSSSVAVPMVSRDLKVSVPAATDVTIAAIEYLHC